MTTEDSQNTASQQEESVGSQSVTGGGETTQNEGSTTNGETPSSDDTVNIDDLIGGWKQDRTRVDELEKENFRLKQKLNTQNDDEDEDDLTMDERVERRIKQREEAQKAQAERDKAAAEREVAFMEKTSPFFRAHKAEILQRAIDRHMNLTEATKDLQDEKDRIAKAKSDSDDQRKKNAGQSGASGSSSGGSVKGQKAKYDPKIHKNKSIGDIFRAGLE